MRSLAFLLALVAVAAAARGDEAPEPTYADKPASWWVVEFDEGRNPAAAREVLLRMGDGAARPIAERLAASPTREGRIALLGLLASLRRVPPEVVAAVRPCLSCDNGVEQQAALLVVERAGPAAGTLASEVVKLLASPHENVRRRAGAALGVLGDAAADHVDELAARIGQGDERTDLAVVLALGRVGPRAAEALPRIVEFAAARPPRDDVMRALASIAPDDPRVAAAIVRTAESGDEAARQGAIRFLHGPGCDGEAAAVAARRLAANTNPAVRAAAAAALGRTSVARGTVDDALFVLLADDDVGVAHTAARSLEECAAKDRSFAPRVAPVWRATRHPCSLVDLMTALLPDSGQALCEAAVADDSELRAAAWHVFVRMGERRLDVDAEAITRMLFDARVDLSLRHNLLRFVAERGLLRPEAILEVCAKVATEGAPALACVAAPALACRETGRSALLAAAARKEPEVRTAALRALDQAALVSDDARGVLVRAIDDPDPAVCAAAASVLRRLPRDAWAQDAAGRNSLFARLPALVRRGPDERRAVLAILASFPDAERPVAALVAMLAYDDVAERAAPLLRPAAQDPSSLLRPLVVRDDPVLAARAAGEWLARGGGDDDLVARIGEWIGADDRRLARAALLAAGGLPSRSLAQIGGPLARAARGGVDGLAWPACFALGRIAGDEPAAREALLAVADDPRNSAQIAVAQFLPELGAEGAKRLVALLDDPRRDARRNACNIIFGAVRNGRTGFDAAIPALERLAKGDDFEAARLASAALDALRKPPTPR